MGDTLVLATLFGPSDQECPAKQVGGRRVLGVHDRVEVQHERPEGGQPRELAARLFDVHRLSPLHAVWLGEASQALEEQLPLAEEFGPSILPLGLPLLQPLGPVDGRWWTPGTRLLGLV